LGEDEGHQREPHRRELRVEGKITRTNSREMKPSVVRYPQGNEGRDSANRDRSDGVPQHFRPGADLPDFLPPVVVNNEISQRGNAPEEKKRGQAGKENPFAELCGIHETKEVYQLSGWAGSTVVAQGSWRGFRAVPSMRGGAGGESR
jgi:hypothetical protein